MALRAPRVQAEVHPTSPVSPVHLYGISLRVLMSTHNARYPFSHTHPFSECATSSGRSQRSCPAPVRLLRATVVQKSRTLRGHSETGPSQPSAKSLRVAIRRRFASANAPKGYGTPFWIFLRTSLVVAVSPWVVPFPRSTPPISDEMVCPLQFFRALSGACVLVLSFEEDRTLLLVAEVSG